MPAARQQGASLRSLRLRPAAPPTESWSLHFEQKLLPGLRSEIHMAHAVRPGLDGFPAPCLHPLTYLRASRLHDLEFRASLEKGLDPAYRALTRSGAPLRAGLRQPLARALALYSFARMRADWLYSLAVRETERENPDAGILQLASFYALWQGQSSASAWFRRQVLQPEAYFELAMQLLAPQKKKSQSASSTEGAGAGVRRLLWLDAAASSERVSEAYIIRRSSRNPPVDAEDLFDLFVQLWQRGMLFRAARLLWRRIRLMGASPAICHELAMLALSNGRLSAALRALAAAPPSDQAALLLLCRATVALACAAPRSGNFTPVPASLGGALQGSGASNALLWLAAQGADDARSAELSGQLVSLQRGRGWDAQLAALAMAATENPPLEALTMRCCALISSFSIPARLQLAAWIASRDPELSRRLATTGGEVWRQHQLAAALAQAGDAPGAWKLVRRLLQRAPNSSILLEDAALLLRAQGAEQRAAAFDARAKAAGEQEEMAGEK
ncbi:MAG: hypothetical protein K1X75_04235 [Leptospirales bacterium]|nr:hypothetical protein [Leptospirales bacterium]